jgi:hypothetical protein
MSLNIKNVPVTSVYFNSQTVTADSPAPEKIGKLWDELSRSISSNRYISSNRSRDKLNICLEKLGVTETDKQAQDLIIPILKKALDPGVKITPSNENTGVYFLSKNGVIFAVFKVGEKRAGTELLVRRIAHQLGLEKHAVPGLFCSIQYPVFPNDDMIVELYNGNQKLFGKSPEDDNLGVEKPYTLTGVLEPYIEGQEDLSIADFSKMTLLALAVGLRDAKMDGIAGAMHLDTEDCMPGRLLPDGSPNKNVAATHLPYLEHPFANAEIPKKVLLELGQIVKGWDEKEIYEDLSKQKIKFADLNSEQLVPEEDLYPSSHPSDARIDSDNGFDHGGCYVEVQKMENILENHVSIDATRSDKRLLTPSQLEAFKFRMARLKQFFGSLTNDETPTTMDMVCFTDPLYKEHITTLQKYGFDRQPLPSIVGRYSPANVIPNFTTPSPYSELMRSDRFSQEHPRGKNGFKSLFLDPSNFG